MNQKPVKQIVPLAVGLAWQCGEFQLKMDGKFSLKPWVNSILAGETVAGEFTAFDCIQFEGCDVRGEILAERLQMRGEICRQSSTPEVRSVQSRGGEFLAQVLAEGLEGVVLKSPRGYFEPMLACKRLETFMCHVVGFSVGKQSVDICNATTGQPVGKVALLGGRIDRVRIGSTLKIEAFGMTKNGMLREPRPDKDSETSWLIAY